MHRTAFVERVSPRPQSASIHSGADISPLIEEAYELYQRRRTSRQVLRFPLVARREAGVNWRSDVLSWLLLIATRAVVCDQRRWYDTIMCIRS